MFLLRSGEHVWFTHRLQRDALVEASARAGQKGWIRPPINFFSELPAVFGIRRKPISHLARRDRISRIADAMATQSGMPTSKGNALVRGHMLDAFFGELLPDGVSSSALANALATLHEDDFAQRRNTWITASYSAYLAELDDDDVYDPRQIHALIADRIDAGELPAALNGATMLHIYALYTARSRHRLLESLARQQDVDVVVHTRGDTQDVRALIRKTVETGQPNADPPSVQPAPDAHRELQWVATMVKKLLLSGEAEPHEIAVVARTGLEDTRRTLRVLEDAGIPASARVRTPLAEISALKAMLDVFRAAADRWSYRTLRAVLASPYFRLGVDLRPFDRIASDARPASLNDWGEELARLHAAVEKKEDQDAMRLGIFADQLARDIKQFQLVCAVLSKLDGDKRLGDWLALTRAAIRDGWFHLRQHVCRPPASRYDIVRLDQRGIRQLEAMFAEWAQIEDLDASLSPSAWHRLLRALLEKQELVLTTPAQKGVQVLEAHDAATASFKATFLIHANDAEFPRRSSLTGLFTDEERTALRAAGLPVDHRASVLERERALWNAVVASAPRVFISYRTIDARGTPLLPSLLVPPHDRGIELPRTDEILDLPLNIEQARRKDADTLGKQLRDNQAPVVIEAVDPGAIRHAILLAHVEQLRGAPDRLTLEQPLHAWNGVLSDPYVLQRIGEKFNAEYPWSASQLQLYCECPFLFMVARVLRFEALDEAEEETSVLTVGGVAHDVLQFFYDDVKESLPKAMSVEVARRLDDACRRVFEEREQKREWLGSPVIWKQKKRQIREMLSAFLAWEFGWLDKKGETPQFCERHIGPTSDPLYLKGADVRGHAVSMRVNGRVDRIDRDEKHEYQVVDYKTSTTPGRAGYEDGVVLQGPLYMAALRQDSTESINVTRALYRSLKRKENTTPIAWDDDLSKSALSCAFSVPDRVRRGVFEVQLAASSEGKWKNYHPGLEVRRTNAQVADGSRFDE